MTADATRHPPGEVRGHAALVDLVFHDTTDHRVAVAECGTTGHVIHTGKPYRQRCIAVVHTDDDGRIVRFLDYWNPLIAMAAFTPDDDSNRRSTE